MRAALLCHTLLALSFAAGLGCSSAKTSEDDSNAGAIMQKPAGQPTDARTPEVGDDLSVLRQSKITMAEALALPQSKDAIEAKFELDDSHKLSLSIYPLEKGANVDAENQVFKELAGDPTVSPFAGQLSPFTDQEHLTRSARDITLIQLSKLKLTDAVSRAAKDGLVYWAIPTIRDGRAGYGTYALTSDGKSVSGFIDGEGSRESTSTGKLASLGTGPGAKATDTRTPELGNDLSVLKQSKITMLEALKTVERDNGDMIEAKFELSDGKLSLSLYPTGKGVQMDAERNTFFELAGDPTAASFNPTRSEFKVDVEEGVQHLTRSARDLTIVQTAGLTLRKAVEAAQAAVPGGFVYWAIPTIRDTRAGYGIYVYGAKGDVQYFFVS